MPQACILPPLSSWIKVSRSMHIQMCRPHLVNGFLIPIQRYTGPKNRFGQVQLKHYIHFIVHKKHISFMGDLPFSYLCDILSCFSAEMLNVKLYLYHFQLQTWPISTTVNCISKLYSMQMCRNNFWTFGK